MAALEWCKAEQRTSERASLSLSFSPLQGTVGSHTWTRL